MRKSDKLFALFTLIVSVVFFLGSLFIVPFNELSITSPGGYPILISVICLIFALLSIWEGKKLNSSRTLDDGEQFRVFDPVIVAFLVMLTLYVVAIILVHYAIATLLFLFAAIYYLRKDWRQAALIAYISTFTIMLIFKYMFNVIMP